MSLETDLAEIRRLLAEAYEHYFGNSDGHCKSSEGYIEVGYPAFFWSYNSDKEPTVSIYSYVLGTHRTHHFENSREALVAVRKWHAEEMATEYCSSCQSVKPGCWCSGNV